MALQEGDAKAIIDKLVAQYERLFGKASHEAKASCEIKIATKTKDFRAVNLIEFRGLCLS